MAERNKHLFEFKASQIAEAAQSESDYHWGRVGYWKDEQTASIEKVKTSASIKVTTVQITGGVRPDIVIDYGDPAAYRRMIEASQKITDHTIARDRFASDAELYGTQGDRIYDLDGEDVNHFRLNGRARLE
jgi:hypothetical protein